MAQTSLRHDNFLHFLNNFEMRKDLLGYSVCMNSYWIIATESYKTNLPLAAYTPAGCARSGVESNDTCEFNIQTKHFSNEYKYKTLTTSGYVLKSLFFMFKNSIMSFITKRRRFLHRIKSNIQHSFSRCYKHRFNILQIFAS